MLIIFLFVLFSCSQGIDVESPASFGGLNSIQNSVLHDLSFPFLKWKIDTMSGDAEYSGVGSHRGNFYQAEPGNASACSGLLHEFSRHSGKFIECSINNSRPFRFCERCVAQYMDAQNSYSNIVKNDEKSDNCRTLLLNADRVQIITSVFKDITKIWSTADCEACFSSVTVDANHTVHTQLTDKVLQFLITYTNFTSCLPANKTEKNTTVCKVCRHFYKDLNNQFDKMLFDPVYPHHVCMDIVDMMNYSRLMWGEELDCTVVDREPAAAMSIISIVMVFPIVAYVALLIYGKKKLMKMLMPKRLSLYSGSYKSYGSNDTTPLLQDGGDRLSNNISPTSDHNDSTSLSQDPAPITVLPGQRDTSTLISSHNNVMPIHTKSSIEA